MPDMKRTATGVLGGFLGLIGLSAIAGLLVTATVTPAIALTSNAASSAINMFDKLPSYLDIDALMLPTTLYAKDSKSGKYVEMTSFYDQNRSPVAFDQIAPVMYDALLSSEDPRYYQHGGIDLIGTTRALLQNVRGGGETQGGSSISQQYVKNVLVQKCEWSAESEEEARACWLEATIAEGAEGYQRKLQEMRYAIALEQRYSKNEILLGYLNIANFGGTNYGIDAAARYYFNVPASNLSLAQAATLAGMVQNPNVYRIDRPAGSFSHPDDTVTNSAEDGYADTKLRRNYVLDRMLTEGKITKEQHDAAKAEEIVPVITQPKTGCANSTAPYFCQYVRSIIASDPAFGATPEDRQKALKQGGLQVYTTLDVQLQKTVDKAMSKYTPTKKTMSGDKKSRFGSAAVSIEATTGRVLAIGQNTKFSEDKSLTDKDKSYSSLVYASDFAHGGSSGFPSGSTFKIFTLLDWLEKGNSINEVLNGRNRVFDRFTNSCEGDWVNTKNVKVPNDGKVAGGNGTPMNFTIRSLNSGFFAMAEQLDLCDIQKVATKLGVRQAGAGSPEVNMTTQFSVLGSNNVSPMAMAGAYAAVANKGIFCTPHGIDRVTDSEGNDLPIPESTCSQQLDPKVAATAAYAFRAVMTRGTGTGGNPGGDTPVIGKTGTHNKTQKWLIESSTAVTTAVWAGNAFGDGNISTTSSKGGTVYYMPFKINKMIMKAANKLYEGSKFPSPDSKLTRKVYTDLPSVIGMSVSAAKKKLKDAGFSVKVGSEVDSGEAKGTIARQSPEAGRVAGGATVTIRPSNGNGATIPGVVGLDYGAAEATLHGAGFSNLQQGTCAEDNTMSPGQRVATGTAPGEGTVASRNAAISINFKARHCGGGGP